MDETIDYRSKEARRFRDILSEIPSDLGMDGLSEGQRQLARRAALMCLKAELLEADCVSGKEIDVDLFGQLSDRIGRAFTRLGLKRVAHDIEENPILAHFNRPFRPDPEPRTDDLDG
jgi:hypothetical protein